MRAMEHSAHESLQVFGKLPQGLALEYGDTTRLYSTRTENRHASQKYSDTSTAQSKVILVP